MTIPITVIRRKGHALLVEWTDEEQHVHRGVVPAAELSADATVASAELLSMSIPYGVSWSSHVALNTVTPMGIEHALHRAGVWTAEDFFTHPQAVIAALQSAYGVDYARLYAAAKEERNHA